LLATGQLSLIALDGAVKSINRDLEAKAGPWRGSRVMPMPGHADWWACFAKPFEAITRSRRGAH
jgi:hypothetical protein